MSRLLGVTLLLLGAACGAYEREFHITLEEDRGPNGSLQGVVVNGEGFTANGEVLVTYVLSATGGNTRPYVEQQVQADANGQFRQEARPVPCPQPPDYQYGSVTLIVARDMQSGISGSAQLEPGAEPDCRGGG
ncbi:MAG: hypothetical protein M3203_07905 [Actinomycetota bacterium]|nr:hypothetical protein [Actinomycetota bacterium]